jgi:hypothetical protein
VLITWPAPSTGFILEQAPALLAPPGITDWAPEGSTPDVADGVNTVTITPAAGARFYRLHKSPALHSD